MALYHVLCKTENGWKRITQREAVELFQGRPDTIKAAEDIFMCELCHASVLLTREGAQQRHFRHERGDDQFCPDKTSHVPAYMKSKPYEYDVPLRLRLHAASFTLELGLPPIDETRAEQQHIAGIAIRPQGGRFFRYSVKERIAGTSIHFVSVGDVPSEIYELYALNTQKQLLHLELESWPQTVGGIRSPGSLFDAATNRIIPFDADVEVDREYLLLTNELIRPFKEIDLTLLVTQGRWRVYRVRALSINVINMRFFQRFHYRLTDQPAILELLWPPHVRSDETLLYSGSEAYCYVERCERPEIIRDAGRSMTASLETVLPKNCFGPSVFKLKDANRHVISVGRSFQVKNNASFWRRTKQILIAKASLDDVTARPTVEVIDAANKPLEKGESHTLPSRSTLYFEAPFDGCIEVRRKGWLEKRIPLKAGEKQAVQNLSYGADVTVFQGLTCVWSVRFRRTSNNLADEQWLEALRKKTGPMMRVNHEFGAVASRLQQYPKVRAWVLQCIRRGKINTAAYNELRRFTGDAVSSQARMGDT